MKIIDVKCRCKWEICFMRTAYFFRLNMYTFLDTKSVAQKLMCNYEKKTKNHDDWTLQVETNIFFVIKKTEQNRHSAVRLLYHFICIYLDKKRNKISIFESQMNQLINQWHNMKVIFCSLYIIYRTKLMIICFFLI